ncbi:potassium channel family protein [Desulfonema magnum]|uniref:Potassium channel domain-containing protein n=1 Tax=Desulfonema magnum TaxID=45655 RepID=A0A975BMC2_9BACT|nr:potassium channel family protein [Desulfonema magnum]QTA87655.1 Potassium channel domain-containing protein [Desulfonema magnum]
MKKIIAIIRREKIFKVFLITFVVILSGSTAFMFFEKNFKLMDALWWSVVTLTTVGYGDISPATTGGRLVGMAVMLMGIGLLGILTASIATIFVEKRLLENKGMKSIQVTDHFIICGWNFRGNEIVEELRADPKCTDVPIVIIADIPEKPLDDPRVYFIRGEVKADILEKASLNAAHVVIILSDDNLDAYARDAKTILNTLTIKNINPAVYTCVELMDAENMEHCQMAKADEVIVAGDLCTNLLVQAALDHGITRMISELVSNRYGKEIYKIKLPPRMADKNFFEVMCELKKKHDVLCLGVEDKTGKNLISNPDNSYRFDKDDQLIVIASKRPEITSSVR